MHACRSSVLVYGYLGPCGCFFQSNFLTFNLTFSVVTIAARLQTSATIARIAPHAILIPRVPIRTAMFSISHGEGCLCLEQPSRRPWSLKHAAPASPSYLHALTRALTPPARGRGGGGPGALDYLPAVTLYGRIYTVRQERQEEPPLKGCHGMCAGSTQGRF